MDVNRDRCGQNSPSSGLRSLIPDVRLPSAEGPPSSVPETAGPLSSGGVLGLEQHTQA